MAPAVAAVQHTLDDMLIALADRCRLPGRRMDHVRVDESDILEAARRQEGLERMEGVPERLAVAPSAPGD